MNQWRIFRGDGEKGNRAPHENIKKLPPPPQWRDFGQNAQIKTGGGPESSNDRTKAAQEARWKKKQGERWKEFRSKIEQIEEKLDATVISRNKQRGESFKLQENPSGKDDLTARVIDAVNAALYLRRPLLITGSPGSGKTSLAYAIAHELQLGPVLYWPITARSTLQEGLYRYDAIARLQDTQFQKAKLDAKQGGVDPTLFQESYQDIGRYIDLGPLGTAFLPFPFPRVLLIDEIDKSDINLPNDLLHLLEEGGFKIPELVRMARPDPEGQDSSSSQPSEQVFIGTHEGISAKVSKGEVRCDAFPFIVMTSNGERDFPPAFLRRCVRVNMPDPDKEALKQIVKSHLSQDIEGKDELITELVSNFVKARDEASDTLANDQLLNTVYVMLNVYQTTDSDNSRSLEEVNKELKEKLSKDPLIKILLSPLTSNQDNQ